jgi:hypothetical protein
MTSADAQASVGLLRVASALRQQEATNNLTICSP